MNIISALYDDDDGYAHIMVDLKRTELNCLLQKSKLLRVWSYKTGQYSTVNEKGLLNEESQIDGQQFINKIQHFARLSDVLVGGYWFKDFIEKFDYNGNVLIDNFFPENIIMFINKTNKEEENTNFRKLRRTFNIPADTSWETQGRFKICDIHPSGCCGESSHINSNL